MFHTPIEYLGSKPKTRNKKSSAWSWIFMLALGLSSPLLLKPFYTKAQKEEATDNSLATIIESLDQNGDFSSNLAAAALRQTLTPVIFDDHYYPLAYPGGDLPRNRGNSADLIVRSYRQLGVDLQQVVHEDMNAHFRSYPQIFERKAPDPSIDHRRVPNLKRFLTRQARSLPVSSFTKNYLVGDLVIWRLVDGTPHIGVVVPGPSSDPEDVWMVHHLGANPIWEPCLFEFSIDAHFRFTPDTSTVVNSFVQRAVPEN